MGERERVEARMRMRILGTPSLRIEIESVRMAERGRELKDGRES
jgi:hypothetical protein